MPCLQIPTSIRPQILPKNRIPLQRPKCNPFRLTLTLRKPTPLLILRPLKPRKVRPTTGTLVPEIHHERTGAVAATRTRAHPVIVVPVVAGGVVPLGPHALDVQVWLPALEGLCTVLETADCVGAREESAVGESRIGVKSFCCAVVDYGGGVCLLAFFFMVVSTPLLFLSFFCLSWSLLCYDVGRYEVDDLGLRNGIG